jgi:hypothetical protein
VPLNGSFRHSNCFKRKLIVAGVDVTAVRVLATHHDFAMLNTLARTLACKAAIQMVSDKLSSALRE